MEAAYVELPMQTLSLLRDLAYTASHKAGLSLLILPPKIEDILRENLITIRDSQKKGDMIKLLNFVETLLGDDGQFGKLFAAFQPEWSDVYPDIPEDTQIAGAQQQKELEDQKEQAIFEYYAAWSLGQIENYCRFQVLLAGDLHSKPKACGHIRFQMARGVYKEKQKFREKKEQEKKARMASGSTVDRNGGRSAPTTPITPFSAYT